MGNRKEFKVSINDIAIIDNLCERQVGVSDGVSRVSLVNVTSSDKEISEIAGISCSSSKGPGVAKLIKWGHMSPFEFGAITYKLHVPVFVDRHIVRHRTQKRMEASLRYCEAKDIEFFDPFKDTEHQDLSDKFQSLIKESKAIYEEALSRGIKKEDARVVFPISHYTDYYIMFDLRNLMNFFELRLSHNAQWETRQTADAMFAIFEQQFPLTARAFINKTGLKRNRK